MAEGMHISLRAEEIFHIGPPGGGFPVTNSLILSTLALVLIAGIAIVSRRRLSLVPGKIQNLLESVIDAVLGLMDNVLGSRRKSEKYLPLVATIFLFILTSNWLGILPGIGSIIVRGEETAPLLRSPASDLNFTLALAIITVFGVNLLGIIAIGFLPHLKRFLNFKNPITFFVGVLEFISEIAKLISFSFRLFGNVFAGEILLTIIAFLVPYVVPLPFLFLEIFVGFIQAFVFAMLALVFTAMATTEHAENH
jgi:F-type H+-transporting ATPase subunit a